MTRITEKLLQFNPDGIFTAADLASLFPDSSNARYSLMKRALAQEEIIRICRGLYALAPQFRREPVNPYRIAQLIYGPSYISMESALSFHGMIPEAVYATTCTCLNKSRNYDTSLGRFSYIRIPQRVFFTGVQRMVTASGDVFFMASPLKALAEFVYARKKNWTGLKPLIESLRIEEDAFSVLTAEDFEVLSGQYGNSRVGAFLSGIQKELAL